MSRYFKIGIFALAITGVTAALMIRVDTGISDRESYEVYAYLDDASGLFVDSVVRLAGVDVGRIKAIDLDGNRARVTLALRREVELYEDAGIAKVTGSLLGGATVTMNTGSARGALLQSGDEIRNVIARADIADTVASANTLAEQATELVDEITAVLGDPETRAALQEIIALARESARSTTELLEQNLLLARATMANAESFTAQIDQTAEDQLAVISEIIASTNRTVASLERLIESNDPAITRGIAEINTTVQELRGVLDDVGEITRRVRDGEGNVGRLIAEDDLYERVVGITRQAEEFLDSTTGMGVQLDFRSELLFEQLRTRDRFDLRLTPRRDDRFYTAGVISTPSPYLASVTTTERRVEGTGGTGVPEQTVTEETVRTNELKLNLQLAQIWGPVTVRAGLFDSAAGVGVDLTPLDQIAFSAEASDFSNSKGVHLRGFGQIFPFYNPESSNPLHWLYLSGGVDDILDTRQRDFFLGAGLRFTDNDIRGLIGFVPLN